ncbi:putative Mg++ transporter [Trypanosoma cruzi]|uniref:Putative Mg++ transporter n=1 Tax=Trypanosoma cruzi TaxID=5693 RepID=A0A2V2UII8_TRYCR|nr:putative Mg++ transporter [Trypanosoma cruzi]
MLTYFGLHGIAGSREDKSSLAFEKLGRVFGRDCGALALSREGDGYAGRGKRTSTVSGKSVFSGQVSFRCLLGEFLKASTYTMALNRFLLLAALLALQSGSQLVLQRYEELVKNHIVVVLFMSMIVGAGGNAGNQAAVSAITAILASRECINSKAQFPQGSTEDILGESLAPERPRSPLLLKPSYAPSFLHLSKWDSFLICFPCLERLQKVLLWGRRKILNTDISSAGREVRRSAILSLCVVLRYEFIVAFCCGFFLMFIGALRVIFFLWFDDDNDLSATYSIRSSSTASTFPTIKEGGNRGFALVMALSLSIFLIVFISVLVGATLPYVLHYIDINIEHAAPIVQVLMDLVGTWLCCVTCSAFVCH